MKRILKQLIFVLSIITLQPLTAQIFTQGELCGVKVHIKSV